MGKQMVVAGADFSANGIYGLNLVERYDWDALDNPFAMPGDYILANTKDYDGVAISPESAVGIQTRFSMTGSFTAVLVDLTDGTYTEIKTFSVDVANSVENYFFDSPVTIPSGKALGVKFNGMQFDDGIITGAQIFQVKPDKTYKFANNTIMPWKTITSFNW